MAEWTYAARQEVTANGTFTFTENPVPSASGLVRNREGSGLFNLSGNVRVNPSICPYTRRFLSVVYPVHIDMNVAIPTGGTVGPITVALTIGGTVIPASTMVVTPTAVEEFNAISKSISVPVWLGCCEDLAVVSLTGTPISATAAVLTIDDTPTRLVRTA